MPHNFHKCIFPLNLAELPYNTGRHTCELFSSFESQQHLVTAARKTIIDDFKHIKFLPKITKRFLIWHKTCTEERLSLILKVN